MQKPEVHLDRREKLKSSPTPLVTLEKLFSLGISVSTASNEIYPNKNYHRDDENKICFPPLFSEIS